MVWCKRQPNTSWSSISKQRKALSLEISVSLLASADKVLE
jgi:hypothetical protein